LAPHFSLSKYGATFDAHAHSYFDFHDGHLSPVQFVKLTRKKGFNWVCALTHDSTRGNARLRNAAQEANLPFLPAIEVSTCYNHILAYGVQEWHWAKDSWEPEITIERLREQGCAVYASHPGAKPLKTGGPWNDLVYELDFDGVEWINGYEFFSGLTTQRLLHDYVKGKIAGSDAHTAWNFGDAFTQVLSTSENPDDLVSEMRKGRVRPWGRSSFFFGVMGTVILKETWKHTVKKINVEGKWIREQWSKIGTLPDHPISGKAWRESFLESRGKIWDNARQRVGKPATQKGC
jgi:predicted metal-dependent phosphoesterase TrpH